MGTTYNRSYSPTSEVGPARTNMEDLCDRVNALNESVQKQLEEAYRRYMELHERHEKENEEWRQQIQSMKQKVITMYSNFE